VSKAIPVLIPIGAVIAHGVLTYAIFTHTDSSHRWADAARGTLAFPTIAASSIEFAPANSKLLIVFRWPDTDVSNPSPWTLGVNAALWALLLVWIWYSTTRGGGPWWPAAIWAATAYLLSWMCYSLLLTIPYTEKWRDFISIFGTLATLIALAIAIQQIAAAKRRIEIAQEEYAKAIRSSQQRFTQHAISESHRLFTRAHDQINEVRYDRRAKYKWNRAADLAELASETLHSCHELCSDEIAESVDELCDNVRGLTIHLRDVAAASEEFNSALVPPVAFGYQQLIHRVLPPALN